MSQSFRIQEFVEQAQSLSERLPHLAGQSPQPNVASGNVLKAARPVEVTAEDLAEADHGEMTSDPTAPEASVVVGQNELANLLDRVKDERFKLMRSLKSAKAKRHAAEVEDDHHLAHLQHLLKQAQHLEAVVGQRTSDLRQLETTVDERLEQLSEIESRIELASGRFARLVHQADQAHEKAQAFEKQMAETQARLVADAERKLQSKTQALQDIDDQAKRTLVEFAEQGRQLMHLDMSESVERSIKNKAFALVEQAVGQAETRLQKAKQNGDIFAEQLAHQLTERLKKGIAEQIARHQVQAETEVGEWLKSSQSQLTEAQSNAKLGLETALESAKAQLAEALQAIGEEQEADMAIRLQNNMQEVAELLDAQGSQLTQAQTDKLQERMDTVLDQASRKADAAVDQFREKLKASLTRTVQDANATASMMASKVERLRKQVDRVVTDVTAQQTEAIEARIAQAVEQAHVDLGPMKDKVQAQADGFADLLGQQSKRVRESMNQVEAPVTAQINQWVAELNAKMGHAMVDARQELDEQIQTLQSKLKTAATETGQQAQEQLRQEVNQLVESSQAMLQMTERKIQKRLDALSQAAPAPGTPGIGTASGAGVDDAALQAVKQEMQDALADHKDMIQRDLTMITEMIQKVITKR